MTKIPHISWGGYDKGFYGNVSVLIKDIAKYKIEKWNLNNKFLLLKLIKIENILFIIAS